MSLYRPKPRKGYTSPFYYYDFTVNGVRHTGGTGKKSKLEAREVESEKRKQAKAGKWDQAIKPIGFSAFADLYLKTHAATKRSESFYDFTVRILKRRFGDRLLASISPLDCAEFMAARRGDVGTSTANASLTILKHMFRLSEEWGYLAEGANPTRKLKREKVRNGRDRYVNGDEAKSLLESCTDWLRPLVLMALHTGGRRAELLRLTWDRIDFKSGTITYLDTKNGDSRKVPMSGVLRDTLKAQSNRLKGGRVFLRGDELVTIHVLRDGFNAARDKAGLAGFRLHDCRHSWATELAMAGTPLRTLMTLGGWRRIEQVQRYAAVTPQSLEQAAKAVNGIFKPTPATSPQQETSGGQESGEREHSEDVDSMSGAEDRT